MIQKKFYKKYHNRIYQYSKTKLSKSTVFDLCNSILKTFRLANNLNNIDS